MSGNWVVVPTACLPTVRLPGARPLAVYPPIACRPAARPLAAPTPIAFGRGHDQRAAPDTGCGTAAGLAAPGWATVPRFELPSPPLGKSSRSAAKPLGSRRARRRTTGSDGTGRPAWQSPYGPPRNRAHRGRWAPVPGVADAPSAVRQAFLCGRCE
ncbi:hypothetical protein OHT52_20185 [Streptomyces sp. NBC_00247]|uniref:hypothetical protein n=1 Tax=Streptomyces sp. NBC_00247 TaxID=2975689 RepID=UPI002E2D5A0B|nr:hypothetical protein [Streptomyces sp. NBC_00247]